MRLHPVRTHNIRYGFSKETIANSERLASCDGHEFEPTGEDEWGPHGFVCIHCKGSIDLMQKSWYEYGLAHGRAAASLASDRRERSVADGA